MFRWFALIALTAVASAQVNPGWTRAFPPHKIAGNLHYVGTEDLACFLLTTPEGHILINTALEDSVPLLRASMTKLGFKLEDVKILLIMQAHYDHAAALKEIQQISKAKVFATEADTPSLEDGGKSDPYFKSRFPPVRVDRKLKDGDSVKLGGTELKVVLTPGHTKGSVSYTTTVLEGGKRRNVVLANLGSVVMPLTGNEKYPGIAEDFANSFRKQKQLSPEIWVAAHASQYRMAEKLKAGSFIDPQGYKDAVDHFEKLFQEALAKQR